MDFSQSKKSFTEQDRQANEAREYLRQTDWQVIAKYERERKVPEDVAKKRKAALDIITVMA